MIWERMEPARVKGKVQGTIVRPVRIYLLKTKDMMNNEKAELEVAELITVGSDGDGHNKE